MATLEIDGAKLESFVFRAVDEVGATLNAALVVMGDKLGLYKALAGAGPLAPDELAARTQTNARYVREWLCNQAAGGYVVHHPEYDTFELPAGAIRLASSNDYANEAFAIGRHALAVQFHPEVTDEMHERWVADGSDELDAHAIDPEALRLERERYSASMQQASRAAFSEWLGGLTP